MAILHCSRGYHALIMWLITHVSRDWSCTDHVAIMHCSRGCTFFYSTEAYIFSPFKCPLQWFLHSLHVVIYTLIHSCFCNNFSSSSPFFWNLTCARCTGRVLLFSFLKHFYWGFHGGPVVGTSPSNAGGAGSIPGWGAGILHASSYDRDSVLFVLCVYGAW